MSQLPSYEDVLLFWFGSLDAEGQATPDTMQRWFKKDLAFDQELRERFLPLHQSLLRGERADWLRTVRGRLGAVIVLDQFSRNMFRDTQDMYGADELGLAAARGLVDDGAHLALPSAERGFCYMPFMHSEALPDQEQCVALFEAMLEGTPDALRQTVEQNVRYARAHRDIVARFGRFPHRNTILGRTSTGDEVAFLKEPGSSF
jgi:uncharacterized protein (DUF924 family)